MRLIVLLAFAAVVQPQSIKPPVRDQKPAAQSRAESSQPAGKGVLAGVVVSSDASRPIRRAKVAIDGGSPHVSKTIQTDEQGAFRFTQLPAGDFTLTASKGGYVETIFGQRQPGSGRPGTPIHLATDQQLSNVSMPLARGAVITGAVYDEAGEPMFGEAVRLYRWVMASGERTLQDVESATTDDRGIYRFAALRGGEYLVSTAGTIGDGDFDFADGAYFKILKPNGAFMNNANVSGRVSITMDRVDSGTTGAPAATGFAGVYYPGTADVATASSITVAVGDERSGIDFHQQVVPLGRLSGIVTGPDGPVPDCQVQLINRGQPPGVGVRSTRAGKDGRFTFSSTAPGQYILFARATAKTEKLLQAKQEAAMAMASLDAAASRNPSADSAGVEKQRVAIERSLAASAELWGMADVTSDGRDAAEVALSLQAGMTVSGHVVAETSVGAPPNLSLLSLTLEHVGQHISGQNVTPPPAVVDDKGDFVIRGVFPGRYRLVMAAAPAGYTIRSALFGGVDVLDAPLQLTGNERPSGGLLTLTKATTEVTGTVADAAGQPVSDVTVIAFSADERFWTPMSRRIQAVRPSSDGRYALKNLPEGEYRLVAVADVEPGRWYDSIFLRALGGFSTITLTSGGKLTQDIRR
jgi:protocatechuate 3,4-dioxygenase beta subunit